MTTVTDPVTPAPLRDGCPTCGGFKMLLAGEVFMCTNDWHLLRCVCGKPARYLLGGIPTCGDDR